jgi:preprotein translocase subunit YajC
MSAPFALFLAQATNAATPAGTTPDAAAVPGNSLLSLLMYPLIALLVYFLFFRPQAQAKKKQEETLKSAKTGDKVVTTSGIHGVITNVKDTTVILKVADNVKLEIEKTHLDKITRPETAETEKTVAVKS